MVCANFALSHHGHKRLICAGRTNIATWWLSNGTSPKKWANLFLHTSRHLTTLLQCSAACCIVKKTLRDRPWSGCMCKINALMWQKCFFSCVCFQAAATMCVFFERIIIIKSNAAALRVFQLFFVASSVLSLVHHLRNIWILTLVANVVRLRHQEANADRCRLSTQQRN